MTEGKVWGGGGGVARFFWGVPLSLFPLWGVLGGSSVGSVLWLSPFFSIWGGDGGPVEVGDLGERGGRVGFAIWIVFVGLVIQ